MTVLTWKAYQKLIGLLTHICSLNVVQGAGFSCERCLHFCWMKFWFCEFRVWFNHLWSLSPFFGNGRSSAFTFFYLLKYLSVFRISLWFIEVFVFNAMFKAIQKDSKYLLAYVFSCLFRYSNIYLNLSINIISVINMCKSASYHGQFSLYPPAQCGVLKDKQPSKMIYEKRKHLKPRQRDWTLLLFPTVSFVVVRTMLLTNIKLN